MGTRSKIKDRSSLQKWLSGRPEGEIKKSAISVAHRAAMQVLPLLWGQIGSLETAREQGLAVLPALRCNLISGVARKMPTSEVRRAAATAAAANATGIYAAKSAFAAATAGATTASTSTAAVATAAAATPFEDSSTALWNQIRNDCEMLQNGDLLLTTPLWADGENPFLRIWNDLRQSFVDTHDIGCNAHPTDWSFWVNWYEDALSGREPDWNMLYEISLIPDEDWERGPSHINNDVIAEIVERHQWKNVLEDSKFEEDVFYSDETARGSKKIAYLIENKLVSQMASDGLAAQIDDVITRYGQDTGNNDLPKEFQELKALPPILRQVSQLVLQSNGEKLLNDALIAEVQRLVEHVAKLEVDLAEAKEKMVNGLFVKNFTVQAGKSLGDWKMWGALGSFAYLAIGGQVVSDTLTSVLNSIQHIFPDSSPAPNFPFVEPLDIHDI